MKEKEFDFDKSYEDLLQEAEKVGKRDDVLFQTLMKEFSRVKVLCDRMNKELENGEIAGMSVGSRGNEVYKSNPVIKDYISAHKALVATSLSIHKMLADFETAENEKPKDNGDWL